MKKIIPLTAIVLLLFCTPVLASIYSPLLPKEFQKKQYPGVYRGSTLVYYAPTNTLLYLSFYADNYVTTEILGTEIDGDFWVTDGYFYYVGSAAYINASVSTTPYGIIPYDGPLD